MGTSQSTHANAKEITPPFPKEEPSGVSGRKNQTKISKNVVVSFDSDIFVHENNNKDSVNDDDFKSDDSLFDENEISYDYTFDDLYGEEEDMEEEGRDLFEEDDEEEEGKTWCYNVDCIRWIEEKLVSCLFWIVIPYNISHLF